MKNKKLDFDEKCQISFKNSIFYYWQTQESVSLSVEVAPVKQIFPGRVSTGGAGTFLEEEEKQLRVRFSLIMAQDAKL